MAKSPKTLFEYTVILHDDKDGDKVIVDPSTCLADNASVAKLVAGRAIPEQYADRIGEMEVIVRPFSNR